MQAIGVSSDVLRDSQGVDTQRLTLRSRIHHLLASLRASMALVTGQYPRGDRQLTLNREPAEIDPVARLARMMIIPPYF